MKINSTIQNSFQPYTPREEYVHVLTHVLGLILSVAALSIMLFFSLKFGGFWHVFSVSVYGSSLVLLYAASVMYHKEKRSDIKQKLRLIDHTSIYILIAGTYTPFTLINLREDWGVPLIVAVWILAILGIVLKFFFINTKKWVSAALYIGLGWLVVVAIDPVLRHVPIAGVYWLVAGGLTYTGGVIFYVWKSLPFHHAIWHLFVLGGSVCHYIAVMISSIPKA